jgi:hypothetical protein
MEREAGSLSTSRRDFRGENAGIRISNRNLKQTPDSWKERECEFEVRAVLQGGLRPTRALDAIAGPTLEDDTLVGLSFFVNIGQIRCPVAISAKCTLREPHVMIAYVSWVGRSPPSRLM